VRQLGIEVMHADVSGIAVHIGARGGRGKPAACPGLEHGQGSGYRLWDRVQGLRYPHPQGSSRRVAALRRHFVALRLRSCSRVVCVALSVAAMPSSARVHERHGASPGMGLPPGPLQDDRVRARDRRRYPAFDRRPLVIKGQRVKCPIDIPPEPLDRQRPLEIAFADRRQVTDESLPRLSIHACALDQHRVEHSLVRRRPLIPTLQAAALPADKHGRLRAA
jgi:hypothetical protein